MEKKFRKWFIRQLLVLLCAQLEKKINNKRKLILLQHFVVFLKH